MQAGGTRVTTDFDDLESRFGRLLRNKRFKQQLNRKLAEYSDPFVPYDTGQLADVDVTPWGVIYNAPYAHYQYHGVVYGPNFLTPRGWKSYPGLVKWPTGEMIGSRQGETIVRTDKSTGESFTYTFGYTLDKHPLATHHWDEAMMEVRGDEYIASIVPYIMKNIRKRGRGWD